MRNKSEGRAPSVSLTEMCVFAMLGALMFASKKLMEAIPNVHLVGFLIVVITVVFRAKALIPLYLYVFLDGLFGGFSLWWLPYLYVWTPLWGAVMLCPRHVKRPVAAVIYALVCALHGFLFGVIYAPAQALLFGLNFEQTLAWIAAGLPFDLIHGASNLALGTLIIPTSELLGKLKKKYL